jgi:hypothetical protein
MELLGTDETGSIRRGGALGGERREGAGGGRGHDPLRWRRGSVPHPGAGSGSRRSRSAAEAMELAGAVSAVRRTGEGSGASDAVDRTVRFEGDERERLQDELAAARAEIARLEADNERLRSAQHESTTTPVHRSQRAPRLFPRKRKYRSGSTGVRRRRTRSASCGPSSPAEPTSTPSGGRTPRRRSPVGRR